MGGIAGVECVVMGNDPATSVVDRQMVHHRVRNLVVLGGSAFPTGSPSNPSLTISALSCHNNPLHPQADIASQADATLRDSIRLAAELGPIAASAA